MIRHPKSSLLIAVVLALGTVPVNGQSSTENASRIEELARQLSATQAELLATRRQLHEIHQQALMEGPLAEPQALPTLLSDFQTTQSLEQSVNAAPVVQVANTSDCSSCLGCDQIGCTGTSRAGAFCNDRFSWSKGNFRIVPFGAVTGEMIGSDNSIQLRGSPLFLLPGPGPGIEDSRFTTSAQQSTIGANITGPNVGSFQSRAILAVNFFGEQPIQNNPGLFFLLAYAELNNERWRFWAGQDGDAIGRQNTNSPAWSSHKMQGNFGQLRPGFRVERYFHRSENFGSAIYFGITQQAVNDFIAVPGVSGIDNGWPNVEARWEIGLGSAASGQRPAIFAIGGLIGETRAVDDPAIVGSNISTSWAVVPELRIEGDRFGFQGEGFVGEAMGTYNGAIGQSLNPNDGEPIYSVGGFGEFFWKMSPCFTASIGYGIDDPRDTDLGVLGGTVGQRARNESYWVNFIWKLSDEWETRFEVSQLETTYIAPSNDSESMLYHALVRYSF